MIESRLIVAHGRSLEPRAGCSRAGWVRRSVLGLAFVAGSSVAQAQGLAHSPVQSATPAPSEPRARTTAGALLNGHPPVTSFRELLPLLRAGHEVVVWDSAGNRTRGRVSSITEHDVVIARRALTPLLRLFAGPRHRTFPADTLTRVDIVDPTVNGVLFGAALAPAIVFGIYRWEQAAAGDSGSEGLLTLVLGGLGGVAAMAIGQRIDLSMNRPIFGPAPGTARLLVAPRFEPTRKSLMVQVRVAMR